jgi:hypothetical protein
MRFLFQGNFRYHRYHFALVMQKDEPTRNLKLLEALLQAYCCGHTYTKRNMTAIVSAGILVVYHKRIGAMISTATAVYGMRQVLGRSFVPEIRIWGCSRARRYIVNVQHTVYVRSVLLIFSTRLRDPR